MGKVLSHPVSFILMLGAWRAGLKGLSAMSKGGKDLIRSTLILGS